MTKVAVVLFNLGGPDSLDAVRPFLFNLFMDPAIIGAPAPIRWLIAHLIASRRAPIAREIYRRLGGRSPLLPETEKQARALETALQTPDVTVQAFPAMRYWHPLTEEVVAAVKAWDPDRIVLLPLYPQYSTTTTGSSFTAWQQAARRAGLDKPTNAVCCWPTLDGWVQALTNGVHKGLNDIDVESRGETKPRVLFSAHGLPKSVIAGGDPYQHQVEETVRAVVSRLQMPDLDYAICYQSRVGPQEWIGPATEAELHRAGADGVPIVVVPVAFVSEHSETLVELDIEYRHLAKSVGVPVYVRVPTVGTHPDFITGLAALVRQSMNSELGLCSQGGPRLCAAGHTRCAIGRP